uniref:Beta-glucuronidase n=1 Tax=Prevotella sp. GTC17259 TaxID=3236795 RepID=A0AB33J843_9BACT
MKKITLLIVSLLITNISLLAEEVPIIQNIYGRNIQSLNGKWNYIVDMMQVGYLDYWNKEVKHSYGENRKPRHSTDLVEYDFKKSPSMDIPTDWNSADEKLFFYEGSIWFEREFTYKKIAGMRTLLYFGAVNYQADVYVNGTKVGKHIGGFTSFNYDVTDLIKDGDNFVVVKVDNTRKLDNVPTYFFDWWNYGGITRDVLLVTVNDTYISDYNIHLNNHNRKNILFSAQLNKPKAGVEVSLEIPELKIHKTVKTDAQGRVNLSINNAKPILWCPENPKLYHTIIKQNNESVSDQIGFRTIETKGRKILLNGKPIFLRGISIHEEKAYDTRRATCAADADTLLSWAKDLGCNYVRFAHYPHNEHAVREAEKMGLLVWSEIPVYWTIAWDNEDTYQNAQNQLRDEIHRDHNRANIIIWSMANETPRGTSRDRFLSRLAKYARTQDSTRLISMAMEVTEANSNYVNKLSDNMHEYVDVVSFNEYIGWYRDINDIDKMSWIIPYDKPVIISEWGGGALAGRHGDKNTLWTEEYQEELYRKQVRMLEKIKGLAGTTPWILKDFRSPRRTLHGTQDWFNRKGLYSDQGAKKKAFWILKNWYTKMAKEYK